MTFILITIPHYVFGNIIINEIAWMGTTGSANDEWIELYNNSDIALNLDNWVLKSIDDTPKINLKGIIPEKGFFLLERTDDQTLPNVTADQIYTGALSNNGEKLQLFDNQGKTIDELECSSGWFAGNNETKQTMERVNPLISGNEPSNWQTSQEPNGTPKAQNSRVGTAETRSLPLAESGSLPPASPTSTKIEEIQTETTITQIVQYPKNIFINEILPSPEGPDEENEWIEVYNAQDFEVDLAGWQIRDKIGAVRTYTFPENSKIPGKGFLVLARSQNQITLQNSGDGLELLNPEQKIVHQIDYSKAPAGKSYNRALDIWQWSLTLTPGKENIIPQPKTPGKQTSSPQVGSGQQQSSFVVAAKDLAAGLNDKLPTATNRMGSIFIAIAVAAGSAIIILLLKKKSTESPP